MENDISDNQKEKYLERAKAGGGNREEKRTRFQEEEKKEPFFFFCQVKTSPTCTKNKKT